MLIPSYPTLDRAGAAMLPNVVLRAASVATQRAMSARPGAPPAPGFVNQLLGANFAAMQRMGDPVLKPFLQVHAYFDPKPRVFALDPSPSPSSPGAFVLP